MSANDHEHEPIPGLPEELPAGESIVWQGSPAWRPMARHVFKVRWVAVYFAVLIAARVILAASNGEAVSASLEAVATMTALFASALGILALGAWLHARATLYTITTHRVVMRIGPALSMTWNLPFRRIVSADLRMAEDGTGDVILCVDERDRARPWLLWPHVAPGRLFDAPPALRCLPEPERVASVLRTTVAAWGARHTQSVEAPRPLASSAAGLEPAMSLQSHPSH